MMSASLYIPLFVEKELHEWESDRSHSISEEEDLLRLCREHDQCDGIYPEGEEPLWESRESVRDRVLKALSNYLKYDKVVVSGHAMMMQAVTGERRAFAYGEIVKWEWNGGKGEEEVRSIWKKIYKRKGIGE